MAKLDRCFWSSFWGLVVVVVAGCSSEPEATRISLPSQPSPPVVETRILPPAEAKVELEGLLKRLEGLFDRPSYTLGFQTNSLGQVTSINLQAEFTYSCDCCTEYLCSEVTDDDIAFFGGFDALEVLEMPKSAVRGHGLKAIGDLKHLRVLDLSWSPVGDDALVHLADLSSLETLDLKATEITGEGLRHLAGLPVLSRISLLHCQLSAEGWAALGSLTQLKHLEVMVTKADGDEQHVRHLANLRHLETLKTDARSYRPNPKSAAYPMSVRHEPAEADQLLRWIGSLPNLREVSLSVDGHATQETLRRFPESPQLESMNVGVEIVPETDALDDGPSSHEILDRFDALKALGVYVDCSASAAETERVVEVCHMDALESLSVLMPESGAECYLHDLPNLRRLTIGSTRHGFYESCKTREAIAPCFGRVRLETLPRLQSVTMPIPDELVVENVATEPDMAPKGRSASGRPGLHCTLYGVLTESVARSLASLADLVRLDLNPQLGSDPEALDAFRGHPALSELGIRINDAPREWVERISGLRETLQVLELPSAKLRPYQDDSYLPVDGEAIAPLAKLKNLNTLRLENVIDSEGEPISWVSELPCLEYFRLEGYDIGRLSIRLAYDRACWSIGPGRIGTFELSHWPETSTDVNLHGGGRPAIFVGGEVDHYVIRDLPHATCLGLSTKETETVRLEGDLTSLEKIQDPYRQADWILAPAAKIPRLKRVPRMRQDRSQPRPEIHVSLPTPPFSPPLHLTRGHASSPMHMRISRPR